MSVVIEVRYNGEDIISARRVHSEYASTPEEGLLVIPNQSDLPSHYTHRVNNGVVESTPGVAQLRRAKLKQLKNEYEKRLGSDLTLELVSDLIRPIILLRKNMDGIASAEEITELQNLMLRLEEVDSLNIAYTDAADYLSTATKKQIAQYNVKTDPAWGA